MIAEEKERIKIGLETGTLVKCALCEEVGASLAIHVRKVHNLDKKEYVKIHGPLLASASKEKYAKASEYNSNWIERAKERGEDLKEYWKKVSNGVRTAIMNSPEERQRRSKLLGSLNKTAAFRKKSSDTAKITSARKDIQERRSFNLKKWRDNNKQEFYTKCTANMHKYKSKPEKSLYTFISSSFPAMAFSNNVFIKDQRFTIFNKTGNKQVDIISDSKSIIIEFDGFLHFKEIWSGSLAKIKSKDSLFSQYCIDNKLTLIRVSLDTYSYGAGKGFSQSTLDKVKQIIDNPTIGVHFVGKSWNGNEYTHASSEEEVLKIYGV
jgi:hypothetical protein